MERKIALGIDFNNMLFASSYSEPLINSYGLNVNAIKGFFFKLRSLRDMFNPDYIIFANDLSREKTFRRKLYKPYKAQRKETDPTIIKQMEYTSNIVGLLGFQFINNEYYEADDVLGMISQYTNENDIDFIIVSSDRDMYQLITDTTYIYSHRTKELMDLDLLYSYYKLTPEQWIELKILQGDKSDNIPGVPGIGEVTALKLLQQFGSIDGIYSHLGYLKPKVKELLLNGKDMIPLTKELVTIIKDYNKINFKPFMLERREIYKEDVMRVIDELELPSLKDVMIYSLFKNKGEI